MRWIAAAESLRTRFAHHAKYSMCQRVVWTASTGRADHRIPGGGRARVHATLAGAGLSPPRFTWSCWQRPARLTRAPRRVTGLPLRIRMACSTSPWGDACKCKGWLGEGCCGVGMGRGLRAAQPHWQPQRRRRVPRTTHPHTATPILTSYTRRHLPVRLQPLHKLTHTTPFQHLTRHTCASAVPCQRAVPPAHAAGLHHVRAHEGVFVCVCGGGGVGGMSRSCGERSIKCLRPQGEGWDGGDGVAWWGTACGGYAC